jgi:S1-C subfamily serine protease
MLDDLRNYSSGRFGVLTITLATLLSARPGVFDVLLRNTLCSCEVMTMQSIQRLLLAISLVVALYCPNAGAEGVTFNVYYRVLMIQTKNGQGTGFTIDVDGRQYLITAKHMVTDLQPEDTIRIWKYDAAHRLKWVGYKMKVLKCDDPVDIAVLIPHEQLTFSLPMEPRLGGGPVFGQDVFFVGFPVGMFMDVGTAFELAAPFGYVKKAIVSGIRTQKLQGAVKTQYVLDGLNIGGFSGSPVVYRPNGGNVDLEVVAVICSFTPDYGPILTTKEIRPEEARRKTTGKPGSFRKMATPTDLRSQRK